MEIKEIKYLLALAACGSVSSAAEMLYISQPSLSQFLKQYEDSLGTALFTRDSSGIKPTEAGTKFLEHLKQIDEIYKNAQEEIRKSIIDERGTVRLGLPAAKNALYLSALLKMFHERYPCISVRIQEACSAELEERLLSGAIDAAVISSPLNYDVFSSRTIAKEEIFLAVPVYDNSFSNTEVYADPWKLSGRSFIFLDRGSRVRKFTEQFLKSNDINVKEAYSVNNIVVALDLVAQGVGYTIVPESQKMERPQIAYYHLGKSGVFRETLVVWMKPELEKTADAITDTIRGHIRY